jgi:hypothetical protein
MSLNVLFEFSEPNILGIQRGHGKDYFPVKGAALAGRGEPSMFRRSTRLNRWSPRRRSSPRPAHFVLLHGSSPVGSRADRPCKCGRRTPF